MKTVNDIEPVDFDCDNCGSIFQLIFSEDEVSNSPDYCPFCSDQLKVDDADEDDEESDEDDSYWN